VAGIGLGFRRLAAWGLPAAALTFACATTLPPGEGGMPWVADGPSYGLPEIWTDLSGVSYSAERGSYLLVQNNGRKIFEYEEDLTSLRHVFQIRDAENFDFEGIAALGRSRVAIANEKNQLYLFELPDRPGEPGISLDPEEPEVDFLALPQQQRWNQGLEALCFDPDMGVGGVLYAFQESGPRRVFRVFLSEWGKPSHFDEPFDAESRFRGVLRDLSGCAVDRERGTILVVSHNSSRLAEIARDGELLAWMDLPGRFSGGASQYEGVALGPGRRLVVVSEPLFGTWPSRARTYHPMDRD